jgi:hypothetical protein
MLEFQVIAPDTHIHSAQPRPLPLQAPGEAWRQTRQACKCATGRSCRRAALPGSDFADVHSREWGVCLGITGF